MIRALSEMSGTTLIWNKVLQPMLLAVFDESMSPEFDI